MLEEENKKLEHRLADRRVECDLVKEEPHFFDRLTAGEKELKGVASVDYDRWEEAPDEAAPAAWRSTRRRASTPMAAAAAAAGVAGTGRTTEAEASRAYLFTCPPNSPRLFPRRCHTRS